MPRKQRFKPSRKPKLNPPIEEIGNRAQPGSAAAHNDNLGNREVSSTRNADSDAIEPEVRSH